MILQIPPLVVCDWLIAVRERMLEFLSDIDLSTFSSYGGGMRYFCRDGANTVINLSLFLKQRVHVNGCIQLAKAV